MIKHIICFILVIVFYSCTDTQSEVQNIIKSGKYLDEYPIGPWSYIDSDNRKYQISYNKIDNGNVSLSINSKWDTIQDADYLFAASTGQKDYDYFVIIENPKIDSVKNSDDYVRRIINAFESDKSEIFIGYSLFRIKLEDRSSVYTGEFFTLQNADTILGRSTIVENETSFYDITEKGLYNKELYEIHKMSYGDVIQSLRVKGKKVFSDENAIVSIDTIQLPPND